MADRRRWARLGAVFVSLGLIAWVGAAAAGERVIKGPGPAAWQGDLAPISDEDWSYDRAAHLLERAGFGGTPEEIATLAAMTPDAGGRALVDFEADRQRPSAAVRALRHPRSRSRALSAEPARRPPSCAKETGEALGVKVKPAGNRPLQPVVEQVLLLAARQHARDPPRRLLVGEPHAQHAARRCEEKMALFWHGHFATNEDKVRDYRKMLHQLETLPGQGHRQFPRPHGRRRAGPGDALLPRRRGEREGRAERELRPRDHGAVHHGRGQLRRDGHPRGGARLHRLELPTT